MKQKFEALTGIRAVAAIMIFVYHNRKFWRNTFPEMANRLLNEFHIGVSMFFVLSGFLITYTYFNSFQNNSLNQYKNYITLRLARIYPVYLLIIIAKYSFTKFPSGVESFLNITLLKGYSNKYLLTGIPQTWSLCVELTFYAIAPLIFWSIYKNGILKSFLYTAITCIALVFVGIELKFLNLNPYGILSDFKFVSIATFQGRFIEFWAGIILALMILEKIKIPFEIKYKTLWGFLSMIIFLFIFTLFQKQIWTHSIETIPGVLLHNILFPFTILLFYWGLITEKTYISQILGSKLMQILGYSSFIFYLIHINFVNNIVWDKIHHFKDRNFVFLWLIAIAGYYLIEKPIYNLVRKWVKRVES